MQCFGTKSWNFSILCRLFTRLCLLFLIIAVKQNKILHPNILLYFLSIIPKCHRKIKATLVTQILVNKVLSNKFKIQRRFFFSLKKEHKK